MKTKVLKLMIFPLLLIVLVGLASCEKKEKDEKWIWESDEVVVTLTFYPTGENEGKFHTSVTEDNPMLMFYDNVWQYYKIEGDMMSVSSNGEFPSEINQQNAWLIRQHTEEVLELEYTGIAPANRIGRYLFKAQN